MAYSPIFLNSTNRNITGTQLPLISQDLDSIRAYQWEVTFYGVPGDAANATDRPLTIAAKQISNTGFSIEDIEVHRVNDKVFYPGKASVDEVTITFDNLYKHKMGHTLYEWISTIYNPMTGQLESGRSVTNGSIAGNFKTTADIIQLDNKGQPLSYTRLYGLYPKSWKQAEFNYATNEFHTIEVSFRYDFIRQNKDGIT